MEFGRTSSSGTASQDYELVSGVLTVDMDEVCARMERCIAYCLRAHGHEAAARLVENREYPTKPEGGDFFDLPYPWDDDL